MKMANRIKGITIELDGDVTKLEKALKDVDKAISQTQSSLRDVNKLLKLDPGNSDLLKQKQDMLNKSIEATKEKLDMEKKALAEMDSSGVDKTDERYQALQRDIADNEQKLKSLTKELKEFGSVGAQQVAVVGQKMKNAGNEISSVGKDLSMKVTAPLVAGGTVAVAKFAEVDKTMALTNATMKNSSEQAELLNNAMKDAAANSTFGMNDAATATLNFARAGLNATQAANALAPAMNLAAGEGGDLDTVSAGLTATINGFGDSFSNAQQYADVFAAACNNSALDVNSLSQAMSVAAPIFKSSGKSVEDAALMMGVMANAGIDAETAANSLKTGMARIAEPTKQAREAMQEYGISMDAIWNKDGSMKDMVTVQKNLHDSFANLNEQQQLSAAGAIFGKNQMSSWLALINTAPESVDKLSESISNASGTTDKMSKAMMSGFGGSIEQLKSSVDVAMTSLGEALAPTIQKVATTIQNLVSWFNSLSDSQKTTIATIGMVIAAVGPVLIVVGQIMGSIGTILRVAPQIMTAIKTVKGAIAALHATMLANPIAIVITVIAALVAAFAYLWTHCESFRNFWIGLWNGIKEAFSICANAVKEGLQAFANFISTVWQTIVAGVTWYVEMYKTVVVTVFTFIKNFFTGLWNGISTAFTNIWKGMVTGVRTSVNAIKNVVTSVFYAVKNVVVTIWNGIKDAITRPVKAAHDIVKGIVDKIKNIFNFKWHLPELKLPHISVHGGKAPFGIGGHGSLPSFDIKWYAKAMQQPYEFNSPTLIGVGEAGSETVVGTEWLKNHTGGNTFNITVNPSQGMDERALADLVAVRINDAASRKGSVFA